MRENICCIVSMDNRISVPVPVPIVRWSGHSGGLILLLGSEGLQFLDDK
jgi:hypothetical protein